MKPRTDRKLLVIFLVLAGLVGGCAPDNPSVPVVPEPAGSTQPATRAVTVDLGESTPVPITGTALTIKLPSTWKVDTVEGGTVVDGPTPGGRALLSARRVAVRMTGAQIDAMAKSLGAGASTQPVELPIEGKWEHTRTWRQGDHLFIESLSRSPDLVLRKRVGADNLPQDFSTRVVKWNVSAYVRGQLDYELVDLQLVDLPEEQFKADRAFITSILESIRVEK